jgi:hypothetical protein
MDDTPESRLEASAAAMEANDVTRIPEGYMSDSPEQFCADIRAVLAKVPKEA